MPDTLVLSLEGEWKRELAAARQGDEAARNRLIISAWSSYHLLYIATDELPKVYLCKGGPSDLVQNAMVTAVEQFHCFLGQTPGEFRLWMKGILRYTLANFKRHAGRRARREVPLDQCDADQLAAREELHKRAAQTYVGQLLTQLSSKDQQLIRLRELDELSFKEIGALIGCSEDTAQKRFARAFNRLLVKVGPRTAGEIEDRE